MDESPTIALLWDASALVKRYTPEIGSEVVDALFSLSGSVNILTVQGYAEVFAIFLRKFNSGIIKADTFVAGTNALEAEFLTSPASLLLSITDELVLSSLSLIRQHHLNSSDATILATFQRYRTASTIKCLLVSADKRLLRAAQAEGFSTVNPELLTVAELPILLAKI